MLRIPSKNSYTHFLGVLSTSSISHSIWWVASSSCSSITNSAPVPEVSCSYLWHYILKTVSVRQARTCRALCWYLWFQEINLIAQPLVLRRLISDICPGFLVCDFIALGSLYFSIFTAMILYCLADGTIFSSSLLLLWLSLWSWSLPALRLDTVLVLEAVLGLEAALEDSLGPMTASGHKRFLGRRRRRRKR